MFGLDWSKCSLSDRTRLVIVCTLCLCAQDTGIRKVAACDNHIYAITGQASMHALDPVLSETLCSPAPSLQPQQPALAWMSVTHFTSLPPNGTTPQCLPMSTLRVTWAVPHIPHRDMFVIFATTSAHTDFFYRCDVPDLKSAGTVDVSSLLAAVTAARKQCVAAPAR